MHTPIVSAEWQQVYMTYVAELEPAREMGAAVLFFILLEVLLRNRDCGQGFDRIPSAFAVSRPASV